MKHSPREHQRVYLTFYLRVFEGEKFIGFLVDISKEGFMLLSEFPLEEKKPYSFKMKLPTSLNWKNNKDEDRYIEFTATSIWSKHDEVEKEFYVSGFEITSIEEEDNQIIHKLIEEYRIR